MLTFLVDKWITNLLHTWHDILLLIWMTLHCSLLTNASSPTMFFKATWASSTNALVASTAPSTLLPNYFAISVWSMVILSPQTIVWIHPSSMDSQVCKNSLNRSNHGTIQWTINKPPKSTHYAHYQFLNPIQIHWSISCISFDSTSVHFRVTLVSELPSSTCFSPLCFIMYLNQNLVGIEIGTSREPPFT